MKSFTVQQQQIHLELHEAYNGKTSLSATMADAESFRREMWPTIQEQTQSGVLQSYDFMPEEKTGPFDYVLPLILAGIVILVVWFLLMGRANGNNPMANFGKARTVLGIPDNKKVTFEDVAGADEEKAELEEKRAQACAAG